MRLIKTYLKVWVIVSETYLKVWVIMAETYLRLWLTWDISESEWGYFCHQTYLPPLTHICRLFIHILYIYNMNMIITQIYRLFSHYLRVSEAISATRDTIEINNTTIFYRASFHTDFVKFSNKIWHFTPHEVMLLLLWSLTSKIWNRVRSGAWRLRRALCHKNDWKKLSYFIGVWMWP